MPLVKLELVIRDDSEHLSRDSVSELADALGHCLHSPPGETWLRLYYLPLAQYAENDASLPDAVRPAFVEVLQFERPEPTQLQQLAIELATTIARVLKRPKENVHLIFAADGKDRVAFGGLLAS